MCDLKVGDKVRIIKSIGSFSKIGDIFVVKEINENSIRANSLDKLRWVYFRISDWQDYVEKIEEEKVEIRLGKKLLDLSNRLIYNTDNPYLVKYSENLKDCTDEVNEKMEVNKMQEKAKEIIKTWLTKSNEKLSKKLEEEKEKLINEDVVVQEYDNIVDTIKGLLEEFTETYPETNPEFGFTTKNRNTFITDDTKAEMKEIENTIEEQKEENRRIANEAVIAIGICTTEESLRKILKNYNIIDKDGKLKIK